MKRERRGQCGAACLAGQSVENQGRLLDKGFFILGLPASAAFRANPLKIC